MPETKRHLELRTLLYQILKNYLGGRASIGSDQFVYWDASDPRRCLAPDAFVRLDSTVDDFDSWKSWERGAPQLAVEIASASDAPQATWEEKLQRYNALGVAELVRFCPDVEGHHLQVWNRLDGILVERLVQQERADCITLGLHWVVVPAAGYAHALRLAQDAEGSRLLLTREEQEAEARVREADARRAAEARIAELEAELRRR